MPYNLQNPRGGGNAANNRRFNNATPAIPKRKIENLPRTGIEYPIMKLQTQFISQHKEHEPLTDKKCPQHIIDEYIAKDAERANQPIRKCHFSASSSLSSNSYFWRLLTALLRLWFRFWDQTLSIFWWHHTGLIKFDAVWFLMNFISNSASPHFHILSCKR